MKEGELIWLAENADGFSDNLVISPNEPGIIANLQKNDRVYIDDGMIKGIIEKKKNDKAAMRIVRISSKKEQIKEDKGINFPDTDFSSLH